MKFRNWMMMIGALSCAPLAGCMGDLGSAEGAIGNEGDIVVYHTPVDAGPCDPKVEYPKDHECKRDAGPPPPPPPPTGGCWVTGGGKIEGALGEETLGGNAKPSRGLLPFSGHWNHVDHVGGHLNGSVITGITCFLGDDAPPPEVEFDRIIFTGTGTWTATRGGDPIDVSFEVEIHDNGERGGHDDDLYGITIRDAGTGAILHSVALTQLIKGNLQIHPSNPGHPAF